jgi:hypothetical protein
MEHDLGAWQGLTFAEIDAEAVRNPNKDLAFPVHGELICKNGIYNHESLDFTGLIADRKYQFVYVFSPAPIKGATGSNGGPIAVT